LSPVITIDLFGPYYEEYYDRIFNYIFRRVYNREVAEDLTAQTFLEAMRFIKEKRPDIENFSGWIYRIATNEVFKDYRKRGKKMHLSLDDELLQLRGFIKDARGDVEKTVFAQIDLRRAFRKLKPREAVIIELYFFENKKYPEIADILNMKEVTLRSIIHRSLKKLKGYLEE
jgi:RNA polymerase sigma-70 factor (ECF subfamily)